MSITSRLIDQIGANFKAPAVQMRKDSWFGPTRSASTSNVNEEANPRKNKRYSSYLSNNIIQNDLPEVIYF